jgi:hypothetical protein
MTLKNLADIGRLKPHSATAKELARLLGSAAGSLADAKRRDLQAISRFDLAYKSVMQSALAALMANGYRPSTSEPGHQQTTIQTLPKTIGVQPERAGFDLICRPSIGLTASARSGAQTGDNLDLIPRSRALPA